MSDLSQPRTARHQPSQFRLRAVGRAVIDVDELESEILVERGGDLVNQRRDIIGFVAHRNDDGNGRRGGACKNFAHDLPDMAARRPTCILPGASFYGAISCPATLLMRANEGPGPGRTVPSAQSTKASRRAAYQSRTNSAPITPTTAPTMTSLGKCAVSTTRLTAMRTA